MLQRKSPEGPQTTCNQEPKEIVLEVTCELKPEEIHSVKDGLRSTPPTPAGQIAHAKAQRGGGGETEGQMRRFTKSHKANEGQAWVRAQG